MDAAHDLAGRAPPGRERLSTRVGSLVRALSLAVFLQWAGAGSLLPLLPLYIRHRGGDDTVVGAVMAGYFAAAFICQYGAGRLSDRLGRLPVLLGGFVVYAVGSLLFLLPGSPVLDVVFRVLQGAGAGGAVVAALATVSHAVPPSHRGRAAGRLYGAELGGLAIGPVLGSVAGVGAMRWLFLAAAAAALVATGPIVVVWRSAPLEDAGQPVTSTSRGDGRSRSAATRRLDAVTARRALWGALLAAATIGITSGVYESCWTLLMTRHGAAPWEIGVSWTSFALPFAVVSRPAGWLADRFDRRWLGVAALLWSAAFCLTYPFLPGFVLLMVLSVWESVGFSLALPSCQSILGDSTEPERHGHVQGLFAAAQTGATAVAALAAGALFALAPWAPFVTGAGCCAVLVGIVAASWRRVPGHVRSSGLAVLPVGEPSA